MALLDAETLADLQVVVAQFFDQTANIYHQQTGTDAGGGSLDGYPSTPDVTNVPCLVRPAFRAVMGESVIAAQLQGVTMWLIRMPAGTAITTTDRIKVGTIVYEVRGVVGAGQSDNVNTVATCVVIQS
jgi:hypothetical protein